MVAVVAVLFTATGENPSAPKDVTSVLVVAAARVLEVVEEVVVVVVVVVAFVVALVVVVVVVVVDDGVVILKHAVPCLVCIVVGSSFLHHLVRTFESWLVSGLLHTAADVGWMPSSIG